MSYLINIFQDMLTRKTCGKCKANGSLFYNVTLARVCCKSCGSRNVNPFKYYDGWDRVNVEEATAEGIVEYNLDILGEPEEEKEIDPSSLEFVKFLHLKEQGKKKKRKTTSLTVNKIVGEGSNDS